MTRESFLERWSRRKLDDEEAVADAAEAEAAPEAEASDAVDGEAEDTPAEPHPTELIDIETLDYTSDFTQFMAKGVPAAVKRQALRKLWTSNPVLANMDGLNDYEDIVKTFGIKDIGDTGWKIGRGFLTDEDLGLTEPKDEADQTEADEADADMAADAADAGPEAIEDRSETPETALPKADIKADIEMAAKPRSPRRGHDDYDDTEEM